MKLETELFLGTGWAGRADAPESHSLERKSAKPADASPLASALQHLIDDLPEQIALLDENCLIVAVNRSWTEAMQKYGYTGVAPGDDYRAVCEYHAASGYGPAIQATAALREITSGKRDFWQIQFQGRGEWSDHEYEMSYHSVAVGARSFITIKRFDITEIAELRRLKEDFTRSLIEGQAVARQRLGRELHDSTAQVLTALGLALGRLKRQSPAAAWQPIVGELQELVDEAQREIRSVTYFSEPPALARMNLVDALNALAEGFTHRTGIDATFEVAGEPIRLSSVAESALYRIAQEGLSNVYRHSRASQARAQLCFRGRMTHLIVSDDGIGISNETFARHGSGGVGLTGMRARLTEIGGRLTVRRLPRGTEIIASIPASRN
ncbi:MAG TPA: sensor histidine kinase [Sphingomicrobium sp.]|nr:sensor histidine kinase [Sphingomicrobium sp.]